MVDPTGLQLPPPADWPAFERLARRLFARVYGCPLAEMVGRSGQNQEGIDIIGRRPDGARGYFGIQCKLKDDLGSNRKLRRKTLEEEVARASEIEPPLAEFILATTAANDADLQRHARALTKAREGGPHPFDIQVIGWDQLRAMVGEHRDLYEAYLGIDGVTALTNQSASQHVEAMEASALQHDELKEMLGRVLATHPAAHIVAPPLDSDDPRLNRAIDRIKAKLESDNVRGALRDLEALREDEWDDASPTQRFRMLSNLGAARWQLGEYDLAEMLFRQAAEIKPDDPIALSNLAAAAVSSGHPEEGLKAARRLLELDPTSPEALLPLIQAQEQLDPPADPMDLVPPALRDSEEALIGTAQVLRSRGDEAWVEIVERGVQLHPDSTLLARMHADATLYRMAVVDGSHVGAASAALPSREDLETAAATLQTAWRAALACDPTHPDLSVAQNLAQLLRALDRTTEALAVLDEAQRFGSEAAPLAHLHAMLLASLDRVEDAKARLGQHLDDPASRILLCQLSSEAPAEVRALLSNVELPEGSREAMWQRVLDAEAHAALDSDHDPTAELEGAAEAFPGNLVPLLALAKRTTSDEARLAIAERISSAITPSTSFADLVQAGLWFRETEMPNRVIALFEGRTRLTDDSLALRWLIEAWYAIDDRPTLLGVLNSLPLHVAEQKRYLHYRQRATYRAGDMPSALASVEQLLAHDPSDLGARLEWIQVLHRMCDRESIDAWLATPVEQLEGRIEHRADLALLMANHGFYDRALRYAYRLARLHPDNRRALERYTGVFLNPSPAGASDLALSRIGPDAVFSVVNESGAERVYRIDAETDLPSEPIDLKPDAPIARAATGLGAGDTFEIESGLAGMPARSFRVGWVLHKHIHLFRWLSDVLPERFDGPAVIYKARVDPDDTTSLDPLVNHLREREHAARDVNADYAEHARSLRVVAAIHGLSVIDTYDGLSEIQGAGFLCSDGSSSELNLECQAIMANRRRGCVVDTVTLEIIRRHDLLRPVRALVGPIRIAQGALDDFIERADKGALLVGRYRGSLSQRDGQIVAERTHPAHIDAAVEVRRGALSWLRENTQILPAVGPPGLARQLASMLPDELEGQFQDDVLIVAETGLLLLSDDIGYRRFAAAVGVRRRAGLASLLRLALDREVIDHRSYTKTIAALGRAHHRFIMVSAKDFETALALDGNEIATNLRGLAGLLGGHGANLVAQWQEVGTFLAGLWGDMSLTPIRIGIASLLADKLLADAPAARRRFSASLFRDPDDGPAAFERAVAAATTEPRPAPARL